MIIAAIGDLHMQEKSRGVFNELFEDVSSKADILLLAGDITNRGSMEEARLLTRELRSCQIPILSVLGNHDYDENNQAEIKNLLQENKIIVLDGSVHVFKNVGFAGVKGFCGGFDKYMLTPLGEDILKKFVLETVNETLKLENALSSLDTKHKVVLLHYAPIRETVEGEPREVWPFCGSSRLLEPINRLGATAVFHGHAHHGALIGKTLQGIPVYNVSYPLLYTKHPAKPYVLYEIPEQEE